MSLVRRYFDAYAAENVSFWGVTAQNEPTQGDIIPSVIITMGWTAEEQRDWVAQHLGPTLQQAGYGDLELMIFDDNRVFLPGWADTVLADETAESYVTGVAVHYYTDTLVDPSVLTETHEHFPNKFILYTEACDLHQIVDSDLGNWEKGELYGTSIIQALTHWSGGWTDWNMVLDTQGGPTWSPKPYNAPIIANLTSDEFYKQPSYYFLAHFSSFIPPGSKRVGLTTEDARGLEYAAFLTPEGRIVVTIQNK
uniref:Glucosylceramidase n=1 Tax=Timema tahoe TaxID=61484 RepID=A0A7R9P1Z3_9NEOP|nr:unnamed protein product [Timema tahoe]